LSALRRMRRRAAPVLAALALLGACAAPGGPPCAPGERRAVSELLYFGSATPDGTVSAEDWSDFLGETVTPRFPDGLTAWPAAGQWRGADGGLVREASWVLSLVHRGDPAAEADVRAVAEAYKARFRQEAVLRVRSEACVSL
jgi:hypothetical protein